MNELQKTILNIFKEFKRICDNHGLCYFAIGGTCIGAVRHNGFIPWDDDIDIAMPVADYRQFLAIAEKELKKPYSLYTPKDHIHWTWNFVKIQDESTTFIEKRLENEPDSYMGAFIDVMPIYGMPKGKFRQFVCSARNDYYQYMNRRQRHRYQGWKKSLDVFISVYKRIVYKSLRNDPMLFLNKIEACFGKYPYDNSDKVIFGWRDRIMNRHLNFSYGTVFDHKYFASAIEYPFEDTIMNVPIGFDSYLSKEFGNYMSIPPERERLIHSTAIVDLSRSYKDYR